MERVRSLRLALVPPITCISVGEFNTICGENTWLKREFGFVSSTPHNTSIDLIPKHILPLLDGGEYADTVDGERR